MLFTRNCVEKLKIRKKEAMNYQFKKLFRRSEHTKEKKVQFCGSPIAMFKFATKKLELSVNGLAFCCTSGQQFLSAKMVF